MPHDRAAVIIPNTVIPRPQDHEIDAARSLATYFNCTVEFIPPSMGYKMRSADVLIRHAEWEIKSPTGRSVKSTAHSQFEGLHQSRSLAIDGRRCGFTDKEMLALIQIELAKRHRIRRLLYITKAGQVL